MDLADLYYREIVGVYPFSTQREEAVSRCTIAYLEEAGVPKKKIIEMMISLKEKAFIEPEDIPSSFYDGSLIQRGVYYCHPELQIISPDPVIAKDGTFTQFPFYQEMKICFTMQDLCQYFYRKTARQNNLSDQKRDTGQFVHLLKRYTGLDNIQPLDVVLCMIDEAAYQKMFIAEPFSVKTAQIEAYTIDKLQRIVNEKKAKGHDRPVWRTYLVKDGRAVWQTN